MRYFQSWALASFRGGTHPRGRRALGRPKKRAGLSTSPRLPALSDQEKFAGSRDDAPSWAAKGEKKWHRTKVPAARTSGAAGPCRQRRSGRRRPRGRNHPRQLRPSRDAELRPAEPPLHGVSLGPEGRQSHSYARPPTRDRHKGDRPSRDEGQPSNLVFRANSSDRSWPAPTALRKSSDTRA